MTGQGQTSQILKIGGKGIALVFILILGLVFMTDLETEKYIDYFWNCSLNSCFIDAY